MNAKLQRYVLELAETFRFPEPVFVTRPSLPSLEEYMQALKPAWAQRWISNSGCLHQQLETELKHLLEVPFLNLFCNGSIALLIVLKALGLEKGNVITTPFTFPATVNVLHWCNLQPVFCDIQPHTYNLNPECLEERLTPETRAILPVHVFGTPCDIERIQSIADTYGLPVIYDAAHAFGVRFRGRSILTYGTASMVSFHATKVFTTAEGGAVACAQEDLYNRMQLLKNFGIANEDSVVVPGINGKMSELQAALGLTMLGVISSQKRAREHIAHIYSTRLAGEPGITLLKPMPNVESNFAYFPIRVNQEQFGLSRDLLYEVMKQFNVYCRKYFYPLCATLPWINELKQTSLPEAEAAANQVLCLPLYSDFAPEQASIICDILLQIGAYARRISL